VAKQKISTPQISNIRGILCKYTFQFTVNKIYTILVYYIVIIFQQKSYVNNFNGRIASSTKEQRIPSILMIFGISSEF